MFHTAVQMPTVLQAPPEVDTVIPLKSHFSLLQQMFLYVNYLFHASSSKKELACFSTVNPDMVLFICSAQTHSLFNRCIKQDVSLHSSQRRGAEFH